VSSRKQPQPVKLIASILTGEQELVPAVCGRLEQELGPVDFMSPALSFHYTDYYTKEIGENLFRHFVTFEKLQPPDALPSLKGFTNSLEKIFSRQDGTRRVNIDPGYICLWHLILATCKPFAHRPWLRDGIYADLTLIFRGKTFRALPWTFPDYGSPEIISLLNQVREGYYRQLKKVLSTEY